MKITLSIVLAYLCVSLSISCSSCSGDGANSKKITSVKVQTIDSLQNAEPYRINIIKVLQNEGSDTLLNLNRIAENIRFINLKERDSIATLGGHRFHLHKVKDKFLVSSYETPIMQFDTTGQYEKHVILFGRANNEIHNVVYSLRSNNDQLTINNGYKMISYLPVNGKKEGFIADKYYSSTIQLADGSYVAIPNFGPETTSNYLEFLSTDYKLVNTLSRNDKKDRYYRIPEGKMGHLETYGLYSSSLGDALFKDIFNDTIYRVRSADSVEPYIILECGESSPTLKNRADNNVIRVRMVSESEDCIFVNYTYGEAIYSLIWDKRSLQPISNTRIAYSDRRLPSSIAMSPHFIDYITPKGIAIKVGIINVYRDTIYCFVETYYAKNFLEGVDEYSNPIVMEVKLK